MLKKISLTLTFLILLLLLFTITATYFILAQDTMWGMFCAAGAIAVVCSFYRIYSRNARKIAFMFDAIDNDDYAFKFPTSSLSHSDRLVSYSLNRIKDLLFRAKEEAIGKEKYYELIMNSVSSGILVVNHKGSIYQVNNEALRLLGIPVLTHISQLNKIDESLAAFIRDITPGNKLHTSFVNERGTVNLSLRVSEVIIRNDRLRLITLNDINSELDDKEIDSWIRLIRVLTHEIMNSITPITSLSDTLLEIHSHAEPEVLRGLETISHTGKSLTAFVDSYRRFTHIPKPQPELFYVDKFVTRMVELARHQDESLNITFQTNIQPTGLILYADENLISQVFLNLLKNAIQAIGSHPGGLISINASCNTGEEISIEVSNNGPTIPPDIAGHIFVPFFTTKKGGSGIGLSLSRQIMRLSGGSIALKSNASHPLTTFVLTFK